MKVVCVYRPGDGVTCIHVSLTLECMHVLAKDPWCGAVFLSWALGVQAESMAQPTACS